MPQMEWKPSFNVSRKDHDDIDTLYDVLHILQSKEIDLCREKRETLLSPNAYNEINGQIKGIEIAQDLVRNFQSSIREDINGRESQSKEGVERRISQLKDQVQYYEDILKELSTK